MPLRKVIILLITILIGISIGLLFKQEASSSSTETTQPPSNNSLRIQKKQITELNIQTISGKQITKETIKDKILILDFWATWCPPCRESIPVFNALHQSEKDVIIIAVSIDQDPSILPNFIRKNKINYSVAVSNRQLNDAVNGIQGVPTAIIFDKKGRLIKKVVGFHNKAFFKEIINEHS